MNYERKSTVGLSSDMLCYDLTGYIALSIYSIGMYCIPSIRDEYKDLHNGNEPSVLLNDVFFSLHGILLTITPLCQMAYYDGMVQFPTRTCQINVSLTVTALLIYLLTIIGYSNHDNRSVLTIYYWVYFMGFVKLAITILKYLPQIFLNYERKSTEGWNIMQILLDLLGGLLSALQLLLDSADMGDWSGVIGNIQKVLLGALTVVFDSVFIFQHYVLYKDAPHNYHQSERKSTYDVLLSKAEATYEEEDEEK